METPYAKAKKAVRQWLRQFHPDKAGETGLGLVRPVGLQPHHRGDQPSRIAFGCFSHEGVPDVCWHGSASASGFLDWRQCPRSRLRTPGAFLLFGSAALDRHVAGGVRGDEREDQARGNDCRARCWHSCWPGPMGVESMAAGTSHAWQRRYVRRRCGSDFFHRAGDRRFVWELWSATHASYLMPCLLPHAL